MTESARRTNGKKKREKWGVDITVTGVDYTFSSLDIEERLLQWFCSPSLRFLLDRQGKKWHKKYTLIEVFSFHICTFFVPLEHDVGALCSIHP